MSDAEWQLAGNILLALMTLSYVAVLILLWVIRPRDKLEWATFLKIGSMTAILVSAGLFVFFGIGGAVSPHRTIIFGVGTAACWWFAWCAWEAWWTKRKGGGA